MKPTLRDSIIGVTAIVSGLVSGQLLEQSTIDKLNTQIENASSIIAVLVEEKDQALIEKQKVSDEWLYALISSGRLPQLDVIGLNDLEQTVKNVVGTTTLSEKELLIKGKQLSELRGDYICAK